MSGNDRFNDEEPEASERPIEVYVNGDAVSFDVQPLMMNGRVLVPLRAVSEKLGAQVNWDEKTQTVTAVKGDTKVILKILDDVANINGQTVKLDMPAVVLSGSTMVPLRFMSEAFGADVKWDGDSRLVHITTK
ncbi:MAG: copper amine oxidase N-terminal domain-containing protein [Hyphomonadaceae bacterium]|nr:copper amine oxidase N-terminal domain-containing protein [Clostridia bacterium]